MTLERCDHCGEALGAAVATGTAGEHLHPACTHDSTMSGPTATVLMYDAGPVGPLSPPPSAGGGEA